MGKARKTATKKMSDLITERRKATPNELKRSKSVRASLRFIGTRFLSSKTTTSSSDPQMQKSPSLGSLHGFKKAADFKRNYFNNNNERLLHNRDSYPLLSDVFVREPIETILKTPMVKFDHQKAKLPFNNKGSRSNKVGEKMISSPPVLVAPKAAQILQIPIKENCEPVSLQPDGPFMMGGNGLFRKNAEFQGRCLQEFGYDYRQNGFQRNSLRLSIISSRRKYSGLKNYSFSSSSRFLFIYQNELRHTETEIIVLFCLVRYLRNLYLR